ncbi:MAG: hypothetical protein ACKO0Z_15020 [Betaproteobacteria bacterium]
MWEPIATAPKDNYADILVAVPRYEERELTVRLAMWDPENGDWTVFGCNWNPEPVFWMPLVPLQGARCCQLRPLDRTRGTRQRTKPATAVNQPGNP